MFSPFSWHGSFLFSFILIFTPCLQPIHLKGEKYLLKGHIHIQSSSFSGEYELPESFIVEVLNSDGTVSGGSHARLISSENDQSASVYEYSIWANLGEKLTFVPLDARYIKYGLFLFCFVLISLWLKIRCIIFFKKDLKLF